MSRPPTVTLRWTVLPYGKWTCADGREVLFNRRYQPIWQRQQSITFPADPAERVPFVQQEWFYNDGTSRYRLNVRLRRILVDFGAA